MLILDTDHLTALARGDLALDNRLARSADVVCMSIVSVGEQMKGLTAQIGRARGPEQVKRAYGRIQAWSIDLQKWPIVGWDDRAAAKYDELRAKRIRIGTMELRIAALALTVDGTLLSRNIRDFDRVPGLRVENWLD
jgi:tRNA(fMet)-specific endonuclease VapC